MKFEVFSLSLAKQEITLHFLKRKNLSHSPELYILQYKKSNFFTKKYTEGSKQRIGEVIRTE